MAEIPSTRSILLIDDCHEDLFLAKRLLARGGVKHPIVTIDGGEEAIAFLRAAALPQARDLVPLIVFCDLKMPVQNGFDVLQWVRSQGALKDLPFYILSGGTLESDRDRALQLCATDYLVKFPPAEVFQRAIADAIAVAASG